MRQAEAELTAAGLVMRGSFDDFKKIAKLFVMITFFSILHDAGSE